MSITSIRAFHNDLQLRADAIARMRAHADADAIIGGAYIKVDPTAPGGYRGCFIGCIVAELDRTLYAGIFAGLPEYELELEGGWYAAAARLAGLPERWTRLAEGIFEALPADEGSEFAVALLEAVPVGADLDRVVDAMVIALLTDPEYGVRQYALPDGQAVIDQVVTLYRRRLAGDEPSGEEWSTARFAVSTPVHAAPMLTSGATMPVTRPAGSAVWLGHSAAAVADSAAAAAAYTAPSARSAAEAARAAARRWQADTLVTLTRNALAVTQ